MFEWLNKGNDACAKLAKAFGEKMRNAVAKARAEVEKLNKAMTDLLANHKRTAEKGDIIGSTDIATMEEQKKQAMVGKDGVEAAKIELEWTKKIEDAREAASRKHLADVKEEIRLTRENLEKQEKMRKEAQAKFAAENTKALETFNDPNANDWQKHQQADAAQAAKRRVMVLDESIAKLKDSLEDLAVKELKAAKDVELAPKKKQTAMMQAENKVQVAEKKASEEKAKKEIDALHKEQSKATKDAAEEMRNLKEAEKELRKELYDAADGAKSLAQAAKDIEAQWKANPKNGSLSQFGGDARRGAYDAAREQAKADRNTARAQAAQGALAGRIFNKDGSIRKAANAFDIGRFAEATNYLGGKGLTEDQRKGLEDQMAKLGKGIVDENGNLVKGAERTGRGAQYKQIKELLDNIKKVEDANAKKKELEDNLAEQARNAKDQLATTRRIEQAVEGISAKLGL